MRKLPVTAALVASVAIAVPTAAFANTVTQSSLSCNQMDFTYEGFAGQVITLKWTDGAATLGTQTLNPLSGAGTVSVSPPNLSALQGDVIKVTGTWSGGSFTASTIAYCTSNAGPAGPAGPQGPAGPAGPTGAKGATGATGSPGVAGSNGLNGAQGTVGATGATGATGASGTTGATGVGVSGLQGPAGKNGKPGKNGRAGKNGKTGPKGTNGVKGVKGANGVTKIIRVTLTHKVGRAVHVTLTPSQTVARQHHWDSAQMRAFWGVLFKESSSTPGHVNLHATNPPSYGAGQFEGGAAEYYRYGGNPNTVIGQLVATANYIARRYGLPTRAYAHELKDHNY